ncbi:MAG TPA: metallophosphoesterase, partial [Dysgonamonadaceae bacterium]|nr:metallophosphoesterase [Dysgonamonadaceae bacterium]
MTKKNFFILFLFAVFTSSIYGQNHAANTEIVFENGYNFYIGNDLGRNGYFKQKTVAEVMGNMADSLDIEFVVAAGDIHHFGGVRSTVDPLWMTNYELIYSHPDLMIDWYPILGNHEYKGNTQAVIDYSDISRRWVMPGRYYTKTIAPENNGDDFATVQLFFIDTTPLVDEYLEEPSEYPDVQLQDTVKQLSWLREELSKSKADFKIV